VQSGGRDSAFLASLPCRFASEPGGGASGADAAAATVQPSTGQDGLLWQLEQQRAAGEELEQLDRFLLDFENGGRGSSA
jgi:hypothetical protein